MSVSADSLQLGSVVCAAVGLRLQLGRSACSDESKQDWSPRSVAPVRVAPGSHRGLPVFWLVV